MRFALIALLCAAGCDPTTPTGPTDPIDSAEPVECRDITPGCSEGETPDFEPGCYESCETEGAVCASGGICTTVTYDPCVCPDSEICCNACGAQALVCL